MTTEEPTAEKSDRKNLLLSFFVRRHTEDPEHPTRTNRRSQAIVLLLIIAGVWGYLDIVRPPATFPTHELVTIEPGTTVKEISTALQQAGVVRSGTALSLLVRAYGSANEIKAGDYLFKEPKNLFSVARIIIVGAFGLEPVAIRIPEGVNTNDMAALFERKLFRFDPETFIALARPYEGYLFPDTYYFLPNVEEQALVQTMRDNFNTKAGELFTTETPDEIRDIVILASIIEREASRKTDRHLISGVLYHRLSIDMPLQVDATFFYTHDKGTYGITLAELQDEANPYNTYIHKGLPPTPIASPSLSSIEAALHPTETSALFYLADREGNTYYSDTYAEHLEKKALYVD